MKKDIKILENIKNYMQDNINKGFHKFIYNDLGYDEKCIDIINAISNLIEENKELKTITQEYNSYLQDSNCDTKIIIADSEYFANGFFKENFIPKSKVKEKIEELDRKITYIESQYTNGGQNCNSNYLSALYQKQVLQELLEKRK